MPTREQVHVDMPMSNVSIMYRPGKFLVPQLPIVPVNYESGTYWIYSASDFLRDDAEARAPGTVGSEGDYAVSTGSYICLPYSHTKWVTDGERKNSLLLNPDEDATIFVTDKVLLKAEIISQTVIFTATNWASGHYSTLSGANQWNDFAGSDPLANIRTAKNLICPKTGQPGSELTMIMGQDVFEVVRVHPLLQALLGASERKMLTVEQLAAAFDVRKILVGSSSYNSAAEGATASYSYIWADKVWIGYLPDRAALKTPSAFIVINHNPSGLPVSPGTVVTYIERVRQDTSNGHLENRDGFRGSCYMTCEITSNISGYLYSDVLA